MKKYILLLFLLILPVFSSLMRSGFYPMHDDMQAIRLLQIDKCISDGQIPCRWVPDMGYGYGYPQFNYYAPVPYYVMWVFHFLGFGYLSSVKIFIILTVLASAVGMYLLGNSLWGRIGGFLSSVFYIYAPYRAVDMYVRGAVGELAAFAILPFIFWSTRKVILGDKKHVVFLALSTASLFTSHNITAMIISPLIFLWALYLIYQEKGFKITIIMEKLKPISLSFVWGLALSSFFILPAFFEKNLVHIKTLISGYFNYISHFVGIKDILFETYWGYGSSQAGAYDEVSFSVGILHWILPLIALICFYYLKKLKELRLTLFLVVLGFASLFMMHPKSIFIWQSLEFFLAYLQFPWRFLLLAVFFFSLALGGIGFLFQDKSKKSLLATSVLTILVILLNAFFFKPSSWLDISDNEKFSGESWQKQLTISIYDYLPVYAKEAPDMSAPENPILISGDVDVLSSEKGSSWQTYEIVSRGKSKIKLPLYYFPNFRVWINRNEVPVEYDNDLGLITLNLEDGENIVEAKLTNTPLRSFSNLISLTALVAIPLYTQKIKKK